MSEQSKRFEKAKAEWLKKIGNRSLAEYSVDLEREQDKMMAEFHKDPKVIKMWADIDKRVAESGNEKKNIIGAGLRPNVGISTAYAKAIVNELELFVVTFKDSLIR